MTRRDFVKVTLVKTLTGEFDEERLCKGDFGEDFDGVSLTRGDFVKVTRGKTLTG